MCVGIHIHIYISSVAPAILQVLDSHMHVVDTVLNNVDMECLLSHEGLLAIAALRAVMDVGCSELQHNGS